MKSYECFAKCLLIFVYWFANFMNGKTQQTFSSAESSTVLWPLAPCQSAFWVPNAATEINQNWNMYRYDGNSLSKFDDCVFTLESDPNTKIEMTIQQVHLHGSDHVHPPCLELYDVKQDGSVKLLKKECNIILAFNEFEALPIYTETNVGVIATTIRYGSFLLRARAVPKSFGFSITSVASSTTVIKPEVDPSPTLIPSNNRKSTSNTEDVNFSSSTVTLLPLSTNATYRDPAMESNSVLEMSTETFNARQKIYDTLK